jgi:glycosyltransferase involved in cell wall biosynthesis
MRVLELRQALVHGNLERLIVRTAAYLRPRGFVVDILLFYSRSRARLWGMDEATLPEIYPLIPDAESQGVTAWQEMVGHLLSPQPLFGLLRAIRRQHYDLLHTHDFRTDVLGLLVGRLAGIPVVATTHGYTRVIRRHALYRRLDLLALRLCQHVICVSHALQQELLAAGLDRRRLSVVYNGIAAAEVVQKAASSPHTLRHDLGLGTRDAIIMVVGRLSAEKGHTYLLHATRLVAAQRANLCLVIVGDGPLRAELVGEAGEMGIQERVVFLGHRADALALIAQCDLLAIPSLGEALGNVVLEAMALGKPVIGTRAGGIQELILDGETGLVVPSADSQALAAAIGRLIDDPEEAHSMGERGRARVLSEFTVERMADGLAAVFASCGEGRSV